MKRAALFLTLAGCVRDVMLGTITPPPAAIEAGPGASGADTGQTGATGGSGCVPQTERCNGVDDSCDTVVDEGCDDDGDGACDVALAFDLGAACVPGDCRDTDALVGPGRTEICDNGKDDDCNGFFDEQEPGGSCDVTLLQRVTPLTADTTVSHPNATIFDIAIAPPNALLTRSWRVVSTSGGATCTVNDLVEGFPTDLPDRYSRSLELAPALKNDPSRMGCRYLIEVSVGPRATRSFGVTFTNAGPNAIPIGRVGATGYEVWVEANAGTVLTVNAADAEADAPFTFRFLDSSGLTACSPFCEVIDPAQATLSLPAPLIAGDYTLALETRDAVSTTAQSTASITVHVFACVWATAGGSGAQDGSSPANAFSTLGAAIAQAVFLGRGVCIAGNGTFTEDVTLVPGLTHLMGEYDAAGLETLAKPTLAGIVTAAPGFVGTVRGLTLQPVASVAAAITATDATLVLDDVFVKAPTAALSSALVVAGTAHAEVSRTTIQAVNGTNARIVRVDGGELTMSASNFEVSACSGDCRVFNTSGAVRVTLDGTNMVVDGDDVTAVEVSGARPALGVTNATSWQIAAAGTGRLVHAPGGADITVARSSLTLGAAQSAIGLAIGGTGVVDVSTSTIFVLADGVDAVAVDLAGVGANIHDNAQLTATATYFGVTTAMNAVAIRLDHTNGVRIANNGTINVDHGGSRFAAAIADGRIGRDAVRTAGASTALVIEDNGVIAGGDGTSAPSPADCSVSVAPETSDVAAGVVLVGTEAPVVRRNGRPQRDGGGIIGGKTLAYWNGGARALEPIAAGLLLVDTHGALIEDNELRDGAIVTLADVACSTAPVVSPHALRTDGDIGTLVRRNGADALRLGGSTRVENSFMRALAVSGDAVVVHDFIDGDVSHTGSLDLVGNIVLGTVAGGLRTSVGNLVAPSDPGYVGFSTPWQRSLSRMLATSPALDFAPRAAIFAADDIDGDPRGDASPDSGPDELVRGP